MKHGCLGMKETSVPRSGITVDVSGIYQNDVESRHPNFFLDGQISAHNKYLFVTADSKHPWILMAFDTSWTVTR